MGTPILPVRQKRTRNYQTAGPSVAEYLKANGIDESRMTATGHGMNRLQIKNGCRQSQKQESGNEA